MRHASSTPVDSLDEAAQQATAVLPEVRSPLEPLIKKLIAQVTVDVLHERILDGHPGRTK